MIICPDSVPSVMKAPAQTITESPTPATNLDIDIRMIPEAMEVGAIIPGMQRPTTTERNAAGCSLFLACSSDCGVTRKYLPNFSTSFKPWNLAIE